MAEGFNSSNFDDDVVIIPDTPSPVFRKKTQLSVNNISPIKKSNSISTLSLSPPGGALSLPGQPSFASERAEALKRKKMKDKISNRLVSNGLSPVKRLSPDKAGFVKSSTLINSSSASGYMKSPNKEGGACVLDSLKHDRSPNMFHSPNLYERIKGRHKNKVQNKAVSNASARYGWPSDSDSSEDEILAGAVDSLHAQQQHRSKSSNDKKSVPAKLPPVKKFNKDVVQTFQDSDDDDLEFINHPPVVRLKHNSRSATQTSARSPSKSETVFNNSPAKNANRSNKSPKLGKVCRNSDYEESETMRRCKHPEWCGSVVSNSTERRCDRNCDRQMSPHLANLTTMCSNLSRLHTDSQTSSCDYKTGTLVPASRLERKRKHGTDSRFSSIDSTASRNSLFSHNNYNMTGSQTSNNSSETGASLSRLERKKKREIQSGVNSQDSNVTGAHSPPSRQERKRRHEAQSGLYSQDSNVTGAHSPASRQERKRRHEAQSEGWMSKIPRPTGTSKTKTPTKDRITVSSGDDATPETRNIINVVSQLEKDEEVARQLQEELDREFALHLQDQSQDSETRRSGSRSSSSEEEDYRYHSPFGDIGRHGVNPARRRGLITSPAEWHMFHPVTMGRNRRRDDLPAMELEQLMADAANSFRVGLEHHHEMHLPSGARGRRRRGRVGRAGVFSNIMLTSPNTSGNDYEALMQLGEMLGEAKNKGLSKTELQRLPTTVYKADENNPNTECHICMDDYVTGDSLKILPCFHSYHGKCIDNWIKQNATCPVCRVQIKLS